MRIFHIILFICITITISKHKAFSQKNYIIKNDEIFLKNYNYWKSQLKYFPTIDKYDLDHISKFKYSFKYWSEKYYLLLISSNCDNHVRSVSVTVNIFDPKYQTYFKSSIIGSILAVDSKLNLKTAIDIYMTMFEDFKLKNGNKKVYTKNNFMYCLYFQDNTIVFNINKYILIS
ncbi:MAG: hypothetical protein N4A49_13525 [Marinifilaceae bacterium]|jgi:hypothetical protein|nr:hypothetical protein [Marinifilaceae bacterium]